MTTWNTEPEMARGERRPATGAALEAMERRSAERIETGIEVSWAAGTLGGEGALRNVSRSGAWIDTAGVPPPTGETVRIAILLDREEEEREAVHVDGVVARRTPAGFAVEFDSARSSQFGRLLDRLNAPRSARRERRRRRRR